MSVATVRVMLQLPITCLGDVTHIGPHVSTVVLIMRDPLLHNSACCRGSVGLAVDAA